jgi:signal transduction histidine kinase
MKENKSTKESFSKSNPSRGETYSYSKDRRPSTLLLVFVIVLTLAAISTTIYLSNRNHREIVRLATEQFNQQQLILARSAAISIEHFIADIEDDVIALSKLPVVQKMEYEILRSMGVLYNGIPPLTSSRRLDKNGILRYIYPFEGWRKELVGRDYSQESYFQRVKETDEVVISSFIINEVGQKRIRIIGPVYIEDEGGKKEFNGVIICSFDPEILNNLYIFPIISGKTGYAWLLNEEGVFLAHYEKEFVGKDAFKVRVEMNPELSYDAINKIQRKMMAGEEGVDRYVSGWHRGQSGEIEKLIAYTPVYVFDKIWSVAVCAPVEEVELITSMAYRNELLTLGFTILFLTAIGIFVFIVFFRWSQSVKQEIKTRKQAEKELKKAHNELEIRVKERTAELQAANKELETFSYSVSHDLRAPLRAIDGFSKMIQEDYSTTLDKQGQHYLQRVRSATQNMGQLIDDLLDLSRIGRQPMKKKLINLETIIKKAYQALHQEWKDRKVNFIVHACPSVSADPNLMLIAFMNLLSNALKFTRKQTTAEIEVGCKKKNNQMVFFVKDNGIGFDMKYVDKLFIPFQRLHREEEYEGTGVGLTTVQRIIHRHGGKIWAESKPGFRTTFYFTL